MVAKKNLCVLILAGGQGTRMKSALPKVLHKVCGAPLISHILREVSLLKPAAIGILTGHKSAFVKETIKENLSAWGIKTPVEFMVQKNLTGSGTAVKDSLPFIKKYDQVLILAGDAPLITAEVLKKLIKFHKTKQASCSVLSVIQPNPFGYGRIVKNEKGLFKEIVEQAHTDEKTSAIKEVNSGIYIFEVAPLTKALGKLTPQGPKQEYYLTDTLAMFDKTEVLSEQDYICAMGINSKAQLAQAQALMQERINKKHLENGVIIINPSATYICAQAKIGQDSVIYPNTFIEGNTTIGQNCIVEPSCWITNSTISDNCHIKSGSYVEDSQLGANCQIGPYAHLRPKSVLKEKVKTGNFIEIKNSVIGEGSKVPHLTYIGDCQMGKNVNVGAGSITCNYDGKNKHQTIIGDNVFVGSNTNFVAPVKVADNAKIAAGSTITQDIPEGVLAIARNRQVNLDRKGKK